MAPICSYLQYSLVFVFNLMYVAYSAQALTYVVSPAALNSTQYQRWAHYNWVWLHHDESNQDNVTALIQGYIDYKIPIGAVNIDSEWATQFNNFVVRKDKFYNFPDLVNNIHSQSLKVILWVTSMINVENPDYLTCIYNNYLLRDSKGIVRPIDWWHGYGALLDYSNPEAVAWWHQQMDLVLDLGVDGFKTDGTDPYVLEYQLAGGAMGYNNEPVTYREYAQAYYTDFQMYTRQKRSESTSTGSSNFKTSGDAGLIMGRPVDCQADRFTYLCWGYGVPLLSYAYWVGDDDGTWNGLRGCARKVIYSAYLSYANMGCDTGGYRMDNVEDRYLFTRWVQYSAFLPLFENGGGGEHRPWMYDEEVLNIYRHYANTHHSLSQYLLTTGADAIDAKASSLQPLDVETGEQIKNEYQPAINGTLEPGILFPEPKSLAYRLGPSLLVFPVMFDHLSPTDLKIAKVRLEFPIENNGENVLWLNYREPLSIKKSHYSGDIVTELFHFADYPVYVKQGAIIPVMKPGTSSKFEDNNIDATGDFSHVEFTWYCPSYSNNSSVENRATYNMRESVTEGSTGITATASITDASTIALTISAHESRPGGFAVVGLNKPTFVQVLPENARVSKCIHDYDGVSKTFTIRCEHLFYGVSVVLSGIETVYN